MSNYPELQVLRDLDADWCHIPDFLAEEPIAKPRIVDNYFSDLVSSVLSQQLALKAAAAIEARLLTLLQVEQLSAMQPTCFEAITAQQIRDVGASWAKAGTILGLAQATLKGDLNFAEMNNYSDEAVIEKLCTIKGIGPWTAQSFLLFTMQRPDIWPAGDLALLDGVMRLKSLSERPSPKQSEALVEQWRPHRSLAARFLWRWRNAKYPHSS